jgi:hypothetical protein
MLEVYLRAETCNGTDLECGGSPPLLSRQLAAGNRGKPRL